MSITIKWNNLALDSSCYPVVSRVSQNCWQVRETEVDNLFSPNYFGETRNTILALSLILGLDFIFEYTDGWQEQPHCTNGYRICLALFCNHLIWKLIVVCKDQTGDFDFTVYGIECLLSGTVKSLSFYKLLVSFKVIPPFGSPETSKQVLPSVVGTFPFSDSVGIGAV